MKPLPPIDPTGAMSSGVYTEYMIGYDNSAADIVLENVSEFSVSSTMSDWNKMWGRVLGDFDNRVDSIESKLNTLNQQARLLKSKLS